MSKILIVFAQLGEAKETLTRLEAKPIRENEIYQWDRGWIALSRIGIHAAQMCVAQYAAPCDEVWNIGLAGCLKEGWSIGKLLSIESVGKYIPIESHSLDPGSHKLIGDIFTPLELEGEEGRLISSDFPIYDPLHRKRLETHWDLVDMEGFGVAFAAHALGKKCRMWKIISDFASSNGRQLLRTHKAELSEKIADKIAEEL